MVVSQVSHRLGRDEGKGFRTESHDNPSWSLAGGARRGANDKTRYIHNRHIWNKSMI